MIISKNDLSESSFIVIVIYYLATMSKTKRTKSPNSTNYFFLIFMQCFSFSFKASIQL